MEISSPTSFSADLVHLDGSAAIVLAGDLDLDTVPELTRVLDPLIQDGPPDVVIESSGLSFLESSGVAALVVAQNKLCKRNRRLIVRAPRPNVLRILEITGLVEFLNVEIGTAH
jgi:anti-sigma B factor antagonist